MNQDRKYGLSEIPNNGTGSLDLPKARTSPQNDIESKLKPEPGRRPGPFDGDDKRGSWNSYAPGGATWKYAGRGWKLR